MFNQNSKLTTAFQMCEQPSLVEARTVSTARQLVDSGPLELTDLITELNEVIDRFHFGLHLNVPFHQLMVIKEDTVQNHALRKTYMLKEWMNRLESQASWADIVTALVKIRMRGLAQRLAEKYGVPMPPEDVTTRESQPEVSQAQTICEKLEEQDGKLNNINASLDEARSDHQIAHQKTLRTEGAVEDGQARLKVLTEEKLKITGQLTARERDLSFLQELLHRYMRENDLLKVTIEARKEEIDNLRRYLRESECEFVSAEEELRKLRSHLEDVRKELRASDIRVQDLERERAELQAEVNKERREVDNTLIQTAAETFYTTQTPAQESISLKWKECPDAPEALSRGSAVTDKYGHTVYFSYNGVIHAYTWQTEEWSKLPECPQSNHSLAVVGDLLTAVGGGPSNSPTNTLLSLTGDVDTKKWKERFRHMPTKRAWTTVVCSGKHLIVVGGVGVGTKHVATVEVMDTETKAWFSASSLPLALSHATAATVDDKLYLLGGYDSLSMNKSLLTCSLTALLQSCQPHKHKPSPWHQVRAECPLYRSSCITLSGELVAVGGCDIDRNPTDAVHAYDPVTDSWNVISHMNKARRRCLAVVLPGDKLMVVGGHTLKASVSSACASVELATLA